MKVRLSTIPARGMEVKTALSAALLNSRMGDALVSGIRFEKDQEVTLELYKNSHGAQVRGHISAAYIQSCGRCLEDKPRELKIEVNLVVMSGEHGGNHDEIGVLYAQNDIIELDPALEECLIVQLTPYWSPEVENGACCMCPRRFQSEQPRKPGTVALSEYLSLGGIIAAKKGG